MVLLLVALLLVVGAAHGQDKPAPRPRVFPEQIMKAARGFRVTDRVLFVIDVSGSMDNDKLREGIDSALLILRSPVDDFRVAAIAFTSTYSRWRGDPYCVSRNSQRSSRHGVQGLARKGPLLTRRPCSKNCVPYGWASIPRSYKKALAWLESLSGAGTTDPTAALEAALKTATRWLTVVLITDGEFNPSRPLKAIKAGQAWRKQKKLMPAPIMVWGVGSNARYSESLKKIAKLGRGGFWVHGKERAGPF